MNAPREIKLFNIARRNINRKYFRDYFETKYDIDDPQELFSIISELNKVSTITNNIDIDIKLSPIKVKRKYEKEVNDIFEKLSESDRIKKLPYLVYVLAEEFGISIEYVIRSLNKNNVKKLKNYNLTNPRAHYYIKKEKEKKNKKCHCC